jgi:DNA modification methylase
MVADALLDTTDKEDLVVDFFGGSGTTLMGAEKVGRVAYMSELEPMYAQHIIRRYHNYCVEQGKTCDFKHLNGDLQLSDLIG